MSDDEERKKKKFKKEKKKEKKEKKRKEREEEKEKSKKSKKKNKVVKEDEEGETTTNAKSLAISAWQRAVPRSRRSSTSLLNLFFVYPRKMSRNDAILWRLP